MQRRSSNYPLYADLSQRTMALLDRYAQAQEIYSIDECFLTPPPGHTRELLAWGRELQRLVARNVGLPVSVGIAPTKTLAKLATEAAKKIPATGGVVHWENTPPGFWGRLMGTLPVTEVWGWPRAPPDDWAPTESPPSPSCARLTRYGSATASPWC